MYVGTSYNDTMSGETLSSISEKSESYISSANGNATTILREIPASEGSHYRTGVRSEIHKHHPNPYSSYSHHSHTLQHPSRHRHHLQYSHPSSVVGVSSPNSGRTHNHHHMHLHPPTSLRHTPDFEEVRKYFANNLYKNVSFKIINCLFQKVAINHFFSLISILS